MPSRNIDDLHPLVAEAARLTLADCQTKLGVTVIATSTRRVYEEQEALYAIGRTTHLDCKPVTESKPGHSWHEYALAWDFAPIIGGKAVYDDANLIQGIADIGVSYGLRWGGDAGFRAAGIVDGDHFQMTHGLDIATALWLYNLGGIQRVWTEFERLQPTA
jgi:hypothetical protein